MIGQLVLREFLSESVNARTDGRMDADLSPILKAHRESSAQVS